ncbi:MAG: apolipoprotein N-acyltransferase [Deltaproteobacteria bacterium]
MLLQRTPFALLAAAMSGAFYFLGFVGFDIWPLIFVFCVPVLLALRGTTTRRALLLGATAGFVANLGGYYWVIHLLKEFAGLPLPLALLGYVLLCLYQGFLVGPVMALVRIADRDLSIPPIVALPIAFCALEWGYPLLFPSYIGNALYLAPVLTQTADLFGMYTLTVLICVVNGAIYAVLTSRLDRAPLPIKPAVAGAVVLALSVVYGFVRLGQVEDSITSAPKLKTAMIQTNLGARDKAEKRSEFIRRHQAMSREAVASHRDLDLIVWPESAYNRWIPRSTENLKLVTGDLGVPLIFGALTWEQGPDKERFTYNTAVATSSTGAVLEYFDKIELLMFGETIPLIETFPQIKRWFPRSSTFTRGTNFSSFEIAGTQALPTICYEDIIPSIVRRIYNQGGGAEVLVNITNDSWYGDTHEPLIHLVLATFRSIETRRAMIRSTNTGISAFIDPAGRITKRTGQWTKEILVHDVPLVKDGGRTVYMIVGDVVAYASALLVVVGWFMARRARRRRR